MYIINIQDMTFEDGILDNFETIERKEDDDKCISNVTHPNN